jgi:hypothetical protein
MSEAITAPLLAQALAAQQARPTTPTNQPIDMPAVKAWFAEQAGKPGTPMTPKEMERWDEKSRAAWSGLQ